MSLGPVINPADVERLARKLCEAHGENPDALKPFRSDSGFKLPECPVWRYRAHDAERLLKERWATFECWRRNPPALYTGKERPEVDWAGYPQKMADKLAGTNIRDKPAGSGGEE